METQTNHQNRIRELEQELAAEKARAAKAEQERDFFRGILDSMKTTISASRPDGTIMWANKLLLDLSHATLEQVVGTSAYDRREIPESDARVTKALLEQVAGGQSLGTKETFMFLPDGKKFWMLALFTPLMIDGKVEYVVVNAMDITLRKEAEEKLLEAKEALEKANKLKDQFVTLVSHDLRSPLGNIAGMLETLKGKIGGAMQEKDLFYLNRAMENCYALVKMIDRLLDISRLRSGNIRARKRFHSTRRLLEGCLGHLSSLAADKNISILTDVAPGHRVFADEHLLGEAAQNVVGNAVKFLSEGDCITIRAPQDAPGQIIISDNGPGIDPAILPMLFDANRKTSTAGTRGEKGMGLGLPLCHDIMQAQGGTITVENLHGGGCRFILALPETKALALVVDDQEPARMEVGELIQRMGADVMEASNGQEAIDILTEAQPHLVLTDISMPLMDGFALLEWINANPALEHIPVIVFTSSGDIGAREKAFRLGAADFVIKPVVAEDFIPRVQRFIRP